MKQKFILFSCFMCILCGYTYAQKTVTGSVTDAAGNPLIGVNILIQDANTGTISDINGQYSLEVPGENTVLVFSFIGYATQTVNVGNQSVIDVSLEEDIAQLEGIVVNALGFKENRDKLGSTASKIAPEALVRSGEALLINGMAGKAAGVKISRANGDPGAGTSIQIRGANTISGAAQPLIIVDGVPVSNSNIYGEGDSRAGGVSVQSRLNDLNPEDIESMQILKGASAAALWGSRAANGVVVITTKQGKTGQKLNISFSSTYSIDQINKKHPLQTTFGQGSGGNYSPTSSTSWGDKIADRSGAADEVNMDGAYFEAEDGTLYYPIIEKNSRDIYADSNFDQVFQTGYFLDNDLSLSAGGEKATFFFSMSDLNQEGIIKNSDYRRTTLRLNNQYFFNDVINMSTKATYIHSKGNRIQQSSNTNGLYLGLLRNPPDFDISDYKGTYYDSNGKPFPGRHRSYRRYLGNNTSPIYNNPLWTTNELENTTDVNRFMVASELTISPLDWADIVLRGGVDTYADRRQYFYPVYSASDAVNGEFDENTITETEVNFDAILRTRFQLQDNISSRITVGWNINDRLRKATYAESRNFLANIDLKNFVNAGDVTRLLNNERHIRSNRLYSVFSFDFFDQLFVNLSGALEAASTISDNFFYPSADVAWQFTQLPGLQNNNVLSFGKLRLAYGEVGVQPGPYRFQTTYEGGFSYNAYDDGLDVVLFGGGFRLNDDQGNPELKPEIKKEFEIGTDLRFFNDRLALGATYYKNRIDDILFEIGVTPSSGFESQYANAGTMENEGIELEFDYNFLSRNDLDFNLYGNFNNNKNEVTDLQGIESVALTTESISSRAVQGQALGVFWSSRALRDEAGNFILDDNGFPQLDAVSGVVGDPNPDWRGGLGLRAAYKNLSLNVLFETSQGGDYAERTRFVLYNFGTYEDVGNEVTLTQDLTNVDGEVFEAGTTVRGNIANFGGGDVLLDESWYTSRGGGFGGSVINEFAVNDGSWTRLRELSLSYVLNSQRFRDATKLSSVVFTVTGRNLFLWTDIKGIDPEINQSGVDNGFGIDYFTNPSTKSYLFSIKINY